MKIKISFNEQTKEFKIEGNRKKQKLYVSHKIDHAVDFEQLKKNALNFAEYLFTSSDWDWEFLFKLIQIKLKMMQEYFETANIVVESKEIAQEIKHVLDLIEKYKNHRENYSGNDVLKHMNEETENFKEIFKYLSDKMPGWWD